MGRCLAIELELLEAERVQRECALLLQSYHPLKPISTLVKMLERGGGTTGRFAKCKTIYVIAMSTDGDVRAFAKILLTKAEGFLEEIHVDPLVKGNEVLCQLLDKLLPAIKQLQPKADKLRLRVHTGNEHAVYLYEKVFIDEGE